MPDKENPAEEATGPIVSQKRKGKDTQQSTSKRPAEEAAEPTIAKKPRTMPTVKPKTLPTPKSSASAATEQGGSNVISGTEDAARIEATYVPEMPSAEPRTEPEEELEPPAGGVPQEEPVPVTETTASIGPTTPAAAQDTAAIPETTQAAEPTPNPVAAPGASSILAQNQETELPQAELNFIKPVITIRRPRG